MKLGQKNFIYEERGDKLELTFCGMQNKRGI